MDATYESEQNLIERLPYGILTLGPDLEILSGNRAALALLDLDVSDLLVKKIGEAVPYPAFQNALQGVQGGAAKQGAVLKKDGKYLSITINVLEDAGGGRGSFLILLEDITRFKELELLKSEFISSILHKIRDPLTGIKTSLAMANSGKIPGVSPDLREVLSLALAESDRLNRFLRDLTSVFYIETGLAEKGLYPEVLEAGALVQSALDDLARACPDRAGAVRRVRVSVAAGSRFLADFEKLRLSLVCVLKNAVMYSAPNEPVDVRIKTDHEQVHISVSNKGAGVSEAELSRVFEKYFRGKNATAPGTDGYGLGLFIAKSYVDLMGGSLFCESGENAGFTVFMTLPADGE